MAAEDEGGITAPDGCAGPIGYGFATQKDLGSERARMKKQPGRDRARMRQLKKEQQRRDGVRK